MSKPKRARTVRREADRSVEKFRADAAKLWALQQGGSASRPVSIAVASQIEPDAEGVACPFCRATMRAVSHDVEEAAGQRVRVVTLQCRGCHTSWRRYYVIAQAN